MGFMRVLLGRPMAASAEAVTGGIAFYGLLASELESLD